MESDQKLCTYDEDCLGVSLFDGDGNDVYLQESDAEPFLSELAIIDKIWSKRGYKPFTRKHKMCFDTYEEHLSALIEPYFY